MQTIHVAPLPRRSAMPVACLARRALLCSPLPVLCAALSSAAPADDALDAARRRVDADEARRVAVFEAAARATVCIFVDRQLGGGGSGVVITPDGYGLTNFHVVAEMLETRQGFGGLSDGRLYPLRVLGIDPGGDVAMFRLSGKDRFDHAELGDSDTLRVGDWTAAMGNPFLVAEDFTPTISFGVVGGVQRYQPGMGSKLEYADCIQVSTSINPGNSGGPLFDMNGRVVGINGRGSFEERGRVNVGLGYAISINQIRRFLPALRAGQLCEHGALGATVSMAGRDLVFNAVRDASPAARAGAAVGDRLIRIAGRDVKSPNDVLNILGTLPAGWPLDLVYVRGGNTLTGRVRLDRLPVKLEKRYELDLRHNLDELRAILDRYERDDRGRAGAVFDTVRLTGTHTAGAAGHRRSSWDIELSCDRAVMRSNDGDPKEVAFISRFAASQPRETDPVAPPADASAGPYDPRRALLEVVGPLLWRPKITIGWEFLGGDDVEGRIAEVIEHRTADGRRVRWKFDAERGVLLAAALGDEREPEQCVVRCEQRRSADGVSLPAAWQFGGASESVLVIESMQVSPADGGETP